MSTRVQGWLALICFILIGFAMYFPARHAGLVHDAVGWLLNYQANGIHGFKTLFNDKGLHPFYQIEFYSLYKIAGINPIYWFIVFTAFHVLNAFLTFILLSRLFKKLSVINGASIAFFGALLFLISPYQTEVVIWKATIHYLTSTTLILTALIFCLRYINSGSFKDWLVIQLCFLTAIFSLEIAICVPLLLIALSLFGGYRIFSKISSFQFAYKVIAPQLLIIPVYFLCSKLFLGNWVGHYGAATHLNFSLALLSSNMAKYLLKFIAFFQFINYEFREKIYAFISLPKHAVPLFILFALLAGLIIFGYSRIAPKYKTGILLLALAVVSILPVLNLYFSYIVNIEGDRLSYLFSVFLLVFVVYVLYQLPGILKFTGILAYIIVSLYFLNYNVQSWHNSAKLANSLLENFCSFNAPRIFILNEPDNFRGAYLFRSYSMDVPVLTETAYLKEHCDKRPIARDVLFYNALAISDSVLVEKLNDSTLKVTHAQWGNWWWNRGIGGTGYNTPEITVAIDEWGHSYTVNFHNKPDGALYLYQCGGQWRTVKDF